jgi:uncharacterized RDD family membrane protein YckC
MLKKRVQAFTADMFIIILTNFALMTSFTQFIKTVFFHFPFKAQLFLVHKLNMINSVTLLSIMFSYFSIFYFVTNGKTFGKMLVGLTVHSSSEEMTLIESMKRSIAYIICAMTGSFLFAIPYFRKDKRSLADIFSGTSVSVDSEKLNVQLEATIPAEQFEEDEAA